LHLKIPEQRWLYRPGWASCYRADTLAANSNAALHSCCVGLMMGMLQSLWLTPKGRSVHPRDLGAAEISALAGVPRVRSTAPRLRRACRT
jgi:hypothetical protein